MAEEGFHQLYKTQFHIESEKYHGPELLHKIVEKIKQTWNRMLVKHHQSNKISEDFAIPGEFNFSNENITLRKQEYNVGEDKRIIFLQKNKAQNGFFKQEIHLVYLDGGIEFTLTLSTSCPLESFNVSPPTILRSIIFETEDYHVTMYGEKIEQLKFVSGENFDLFRQRHLENPERRWPLVVFSKFHVDEEVFDYWDIAKRLHGFAIPVKMAPSATYKLRELFGEAPHRGGIAIYHPKNTGLEPSYIKMSTIKTIGFKQLAFVLDRQCINSTLKSIDPRKSKAYLFHKQWTAVQSERMRHNDTLDDNKKESIELRVENSNLHEINEELELYLDYAGEHIVNLSKQINTLQAEIEKLTPEITEPESQSKSVEDVLDNLKDTFGGSVRIFDDAKKSASKSSYSKISRLEDTLHNLIVIIIPMLKNKASMLDIKKSVNQQISGIAWNENPSTMKSKKYADQRIFSYKDKRGNKCSKMMEQHITFPGRKGGSPISVYFAISEHPREVEIGYCGDHLDGISGRKNH